MINVGVSLVSVRQLDKINLEILRKDSNFSHVSVAPSHFFNEGRPLRGTQLEMQCMEVAASGKRVSSIQGVTYGVDFSSRQAMTDRVEWIREILDYLGCETVVLGAANVRVSKTDWDMCLNLLRTGLGNTRRVVVENICVEQCSADINHPWTCAPELCLGSVFDFANAFDCEVFSPSGLAASRNFELAHISGSDHTARLESANVDEFAKSLGNLMRSGLRDFVVEISEPELKALLALCGDFAERHLVD